MKKLSHSQQSSICDYLTNIVTIMSSLSFFNLFKSGIKIHYKEYSGHKLPKNAQFYTDQTGSIHIYNGKYDNLSAYVSTPSINLHISTNMLIFIMTAFLLLILCIWKYNIVKHQ